MLRKLLSLLYKFSPNLNVLNSQGTKVYLVSFTNTKRRFKPKLKNKKTGPFFVSQLSMNTETELGNILCIILSKVAAMLLNYLFLIFFL